MKEFIAMSQTNTLNAVRIQNKSFVIIWLFQVRGVENSLNYLGNYFPLFIQHV